MFKESNYTPNQEAEIEKQRTLSDTELLKGGAKYKINEKTGDKILHPTKEQVEKIHAKIEKIIEDGITTYENLKSDDLDVYFDVLDENIKYEFELEEEQRLEVDYSQFEVKSWTTHVIDTYDQSGRCRIRIKDGKPRMSIKVPLFSRDVEVGHMKLKCCIRLEFKPRNNNQEEDLLKIRKLILQEPGTQTHEKWGVPISLKNGVKSWLNRNDQGKSWIEVDSSEDIKDLLPDGLIYLGHKKSYIKTPDSSTRESVPEYLKNIPMIKELVKNLGDSKLFGKIFHSNLEEGSRTAKGKLDSSVSKDKEKKMIKKEITPEHAKNNIDKVLQFIIKNKNQPLEQPEDIKNIVEEITRIVNDGILEDPIGYRTWEVSYGRKTPQEKIGQEIENFYRGLLDKMKLAEQGDYDPVKLVSWIELEINKHIHPYADGCGRVSKALSALILYRLNHPLPKYGKREDYLKTMNTSDEAFEDYIKKSMNQTIIKYYVK